MTIRRAHVPPNVLDDIKSSLTLPRDAAHRFAHVLRLEEGAAIELFDGTGRVLTGEFAPPDRLRQVSLKTVEDVLPPLVVAQAMTKTEKLELVAQKCTELGMSALVLVETARSQVHLEGDRADKRRARLARIADDAARQCGRVKVPDVDGPLSFDALVARVQTFAGRSVVAVVGAPESLSDAVRERASAGVLIVVGPEGGLTDQEVAALEAAGARPVRLGAYVLRTETAAMAALAVVQSALGLA